MIRETQHTLQVQPIAAEPWGYVVGAVDEAFMGFYWHVRRNARRLSRLMLAMLPLMLLLVGSCKTSEVTDNFTRKNEVAQLRAALFPDRPAASGDYRPASGYVSRAQDFVQSNPAALSKLTEEEIGFLFGKPSMERKDADARIWQYKTPSCVMDVFFYGGDQSPVSYIDYRIKGDLEQGAAARTEPLPARNQSKCLRKIVGAGFDSYRG